MTRVFQGMLKFCFRIFVILSNLQLKLGNFVKFVKLPILRKFGKRKAKKRNSGKRKEKGEFKETKETCSAFFRP